MGAFLKAFAKFNVFSGRATRGEFWGFTIINMIIWGIIFFLYSIGTSGPINTIMLVIIILYFAASVIPTLALISRRWHDIGRTGKWIVLLLIPGAGLLATFGFFLYRGDDFTNYYGRDPLDDGHKRRRKR